MGGGGPSIEYISATSDFPFLPLVNNIHGAEDRECNRGLSFTSLCTKSSSSFSFSDQSVFHRLDNIEGVDRELCEGWSKSSSGDNRGWCGS
jgi:hypothetical protein